LFGYIRAHRPELKVKENEYYRAIYCGLCREMGRCTGQCSRATLSYDLTFFSLVRMVLSGTDPKIERKRCIAHPLRKRAFVISNIELEISACTSAILTYYKVMDDLSDERGVRRARAYLILPFARAARKRAKKKHPTLDSAVSSHISRLSELERESGRTPDEIASVFGELMGELMSYGYDGARKKIAHAIGLHIGKWTYFADAADDMEKDAKSGAFNPLLSLYRDTKLADAQKEELFHALILELSDAEASFDLLEYRATECEINDISEAIIKNILYFGMPNVQRSVIYKDGCKTCQKGLRND
jgi:hypothetical protein